MRNYYPVTFKIEFHLQIRIFCTISLLILEGKDGIDVESIEPINSFWYGKCTSVVLKKPRKAMEVMMIQIQFLEG